MVLLVGERSRSLAILLAGLPIPASNATSTAVKKHLHTYNGLGYVNSAPYKTGAGRGNPKLTKATPDAESVFFCVCYMCHSMAWCAYLMTNSPQAFDHATAHHAAHNGAVYCLPFGVSLPLLVRVTVISRVNSTSCRPRMVTLAGQPQGWPVPFVPGISTPVNVTAPIERGNSSGDSLNQNKGGRLMATTPTPSHPQIVYLPLVDAVDTGASREWQLMQQTEINLLYRVKRALDRAGVEWIDTRAGETSPVKTDNAEGCEDIRYAVCQRQYYGDTLTRTCYLSRVFICRNAAQEYAEQYSQEFKTGQFTVQCEVTELTPQIVNEIRHEYGWNTPTTIYRVLSDNWREASDNAQ
ncbi:TPA: ash family protein [Salmonella enterica subsp. enterica serovar Muenchen]